MSQFINLKLSHLYNLLQKRGYQEESRAIKKLGSESLSDKILILVHPDCIFEQYFSAERGIKLLPRLEQYIEKVKSKINSGQYKEVFTELFFSNSFDIKNFILNDYEKKSEEEFDYINKINQMFKDFVGFLNQNTIAFYRYDSRLLHYNSKIIPMILKDYPLHQFCFAGGYREICVRDAMKAFEVFQNFKEYTLDEDLSYTRESFLS